MSWFKLIAGISQDPRISQLFQMGRAEQDAKQAAQAQLGIIPKGWAGPTTTAQAMATQPEAYKAYQDNFSLPKHDGLSQWSQNYITSHPEMTSLAGLSSRTVHLNSLMPPANAGIPAGMGMGTQRPAMNGGLPAMGGAATQRLFAPDGSMKEVPASQVQHYLSRGARLG